MANELHLSSKNNHAADTAPRLTRRLSAAVIAAVFALGLIAVESWAIERAPALIATCDVAKIGDRDGTLGVLLKLDPSPVAVLH